jgi:hypothetical protein
VNRPPLRKTAIVGTRTHVGHHNIHESCGTYSRFVPSVISVSTSPSIHSLAASFNSIEICAFLSLPPRPRLSLSKLLPWIKSVPSRTFAIRFLRTGPTCFTPRPSLPMLFTTPLSVDRHSSPTAPLITAISHLHTDMQERTTGYYRSTGSLLLANSKTDG